jgi:NAD(P)-dependent dehydrogenase (short-subunit alcohol dehydrogenase family)
MRNVFITGATSGIGLVVACKLAACGNKVIATARSLERGNTLIAYYKSHYPNGKGTIEIILCDLTSFESIVNACNQVKTTTTHIDILINNAGLWNSSCRESSNKIEETLQVNVLAPLLINHLLLDLLLKSKDAKSIFAASALHQGNVDFSNLEYKNNFNGFKAYRQSKLEIILLARLLAKKLRESNIAVYSEHPGFVSTRLGRDTNWFSKLFFQLFGSSPEKGARTIIYLTEMNKGRLVSGEYYADKTVKKITSQSYDMEVAEKLLERLTVYLEDFLESPSLILEPKIKQFAN